ncbi:MAG: sigma-70 family RNA polymerase sigma factor [Deltaproteobacteria bacterium]|nr:sigma-70 family RNA polymerase sigma factor [Deltaproteobacteria bacterium]
MAEADALEITRLLQGWRKGDEQCLEQLWELVYRRLSRLAASYLQNERVGHTLETGALVNEVFLRLTQQNQVRWQDRAHFFALAASMMRRILVDHARRSQASKRGNGMQTICLHELHELGRSDHPDLVRLDEALLDLEAEDPSLANLVVMRYFGGLTRGEIAEALATSTTTVARQWRTARAWLYAYLAESSPP